jgi:O-antigen/teichoic acid export membrane protein
LTSRTDSFLEHVKARLAGSPLLYRMARGAFWTLLGGLSARGLTMVSTVVVARLLGREGYGEIGMVQSTMGMFGVVAGFGLGEAATKYVAEYRIKCPARAGRILVLSTLLSVAFALSASILCMVLGPWLSTYSLAKPELGPLLALGSLLLFVSAMGGFFLGALAGFEAFREIATINVAQGVASPLVAIPLVWFFGTKGAIGALIITTLLSAILSCFVMLKKSRAFGMSLAWEKRIWRERQIVLSYSMPAVLAGAMVAPATWVTNALLANQPNGYEQLGLFNAANQWRVAVAFLPGLVAASMLPIYSESHGRENGDDFRRALRINAWLIWALALPLAIAAIIYGNQLASVFGKTFTDAGPVTSLIMVGIFFNVINTPVTLAMAGASRMWVLAYMNFLWAAVLIVSSLFFVPTHAAIGLASSYAIAFFVHSMWVFGYAKHRLCPDLFRGWSHVPVLTVIVMALAICCRNLSGAWEVMKAATALGSFLPIALVMRRELLRSSVSTLAN